MCIRDRVMRQRSALCVLHAVLKQQAITLQMYEVIQRLNLKIRVHCNKKPGPESGLFVCYVHLLVCVYDMCI